VSSWLAIASMIEQNFDDVREELRTWREDNTRHSEEVVEKWLDCIRHHTDKLADERWMVEEQVFIAALDCNRLPIADQCLKSLKQRFPNSLRVAKLQAMKLEALDRFDDALTIYERILREDETNSAARKRKVACLRSQKRYIEAIRELSEYLNTFMSDSEAWQELADLYLKVGDYNKAAFCTEELLLHHPHSALFFTRLAEIRYTQGGLENIEMAKTYFGQAVKVNKGHVRALYGLQLSCASIAGSSKATPLKRRDAAKVAQWAGQLLAKRYAENGVAELEETLECLKL